MKKDRNYHGAGSGDASQKKSVRRPEFGYIYLVKNPSSNELSVCASEEPLERGTHVIAPSRYGADYGMIVGSAMAMGGYEPGSTECQGACLHGESFDEAYAVDEDLVAAAEPDGNSEDLAKTEVSGSVADDDAHGIGCNGCCGKGAKENADVPVKISGEIDWIERLATKADHERYLELTAMENEALVLCREKVLAHGLDMKLVSAHYLFGEPKIIFFFTAANRVDFRDLVKDLVSVFRIRIELRQIGVRDESRVLGGLAVCGRDFCCHAITDKLNPVSIKMAKEQNLSLNSTKISGPCGRLLCCLSYEYDFYSEEKRKLPQEGSRLKVQHELMKITEVNLLSRKISLVSPEGRHLVIPFTAVYHNEETSRWEIDRAYLDEFLAT
ncbi:MAG: regulatory iron-sulfur-containing complex subunit RicT [Sphaerochaetaceae bacterium]|nr:regulatory iron-sulfur-containing complex subunit RicT [Sphaerochaetaceae bacterium]